jgi:hypothetical protein
MATDGGAGGPEWLRDAQLTVVALLGGGFFGSAIRDLLQWMRGAKRDSADTEVVIIDAQTRYFKEIRDAYADRVADLTNEVSKLREEVIALRGAYDQQQRDHSIQMLNLRVQMEEAHRAQMEALRIQLEEARASRNWGHEGPSL